MQGFLKHIPMLGLVLGVAVVAPRTAAAQETQSRDTAAATQDTIQNPPGYRGMERPSNVFPTDSGNADSALGGDSLRSDTGVVDTTATDSLLGDSAAADTTRVGDTQPKTPSGATPRLPAQRGDTTGQAGRSSPGTSGP
jgi:hypothetical protein